MKLDLKQHLFLLLSVIIPLIVYLATAPRYPVAFGDSDELTTAAYFFGLPHPPGYPLLNILIFFFSHLPFPATIAFKANLVSILAASAAVGVFFLLCQKLWNSINIKFIKRSDQKKQSAYPLLSHLVPFCLALFLAFTPLFWTYATVAEVFALDSLFALIVVFLTLKLLSKWEQRTWYFLSLTIGLSLAHQQKTILIIIPSLLLLHKHLKRSIPQAIKGFVLMLVVSLILYATLFTFANRNAPQSWNVEYDLNGIWHYLSRGDYAAKHESNAYFSSFIGIDNFHALFYYLQEMINQLSIPVIILSVLGLFLLFKYLPKNIAFYLSSLFILSGPFIGFYLTLIFDPQMPAYQSLIMAITQRMYILGLTFWILLLIMPIMFLLKLINNQTLFFILLVAMPFLQFISRYQDQQLSGYNAIEQYNQQIFSSLPANAAIACFSDISCFSLIYHQSVSKLRSDVAVLPVTIKMQNYLLANNPELFRMQYSQNPQRISAIIAQAMYTGRRVFVAEISPDYIQFMGLDGQAFYLTPHDVIFEITATPQINTLSSQYIYEQSLKKSKLPFVKAFAATLLEQYAKNGTLYARLNEKKLANENYYKALQIDPQNYTVQSLLKDLASYSGDPVYIERSKSLLTVNDVLALSVNCQNDLPCITSVYQMASYKEPYNVAIRQKLQELYGNIGMNLAAEEEKANIEYLISQISPNTLD